MDSMRILSGKSRRNAEMFTNALVMASLLSLIPLSWNSNVKGE